MTVHDINEHFGDTKHDSIDIKDTGTDPSQNGEIRNNSGIIKAQSNGVVSDILSGGTTNLRNVVSQTTNYTASDKDVVLGDASGGNITITLPSPSADIRVDVKKTDSSGNTVTISNNGGETIDGQSTIDLTSQYDSYTVVSDGTNWYII